MDADQFTKVSVEASPDKITDFITLFRDDYVAHLSHVRQCVTEALEGHEIYKIYGRDEKQSGEVLKEPRKIRLKFNRFHAKEGNEFGSFWDLPDIVGFTIVVAYPSEISSVSAVIDELINQGEFFSENPPSPSEAEDAKEFIKSEHGRAFRKKGYFGCHYNLRKIGLNRKTLPICEIQIKTVLFDAWGAKTHDLTYKTAASVDATLTKAFELLGDTLALVDLQSDNVRASIIDQHSVRAGHMEEWLLHTRNEISQGLVGDDGQLEIIYRNAMAFTPTTPLRDFYKLMKECIGLFELPESTGKPSEPHQNINPNKKKASIILFFAAMNSRHPRMISEAREILLAWERSIENPIAQLHACGISALVNFFCGDPETAVTEAVRGIEKAKIVEIQKTDSVYNFYLRRLASLQLAAAYYYAFLIGSHEGKEIDARTNAMEHLDQFYESRKHLGSGPIFPSPTDPEEIVSRLSSGDEDEDYKNFMNFDSEFFIRTLTCTSIEEFEQNYSALKELHKNPPQVARSEAGLLFKFHDYCARIRLAQIEKDHFGSSQS